MKPEQVLQFGAGVFLRAFAEPLIQQSNADTRVVIVESIGDKTANLLNENGGRYDVLLRGLQNGQLVEDRIPITCVSRAISARRQWKELLDLARTPDLRFVISNTTEAGIEFRSDDRFDDVPPASFPGKLTRLMYERFSANQPGLILFPCELIERNGEALRTTVLQTAANWKLPEPFRRWVEHDNTFTNTLVDRIVTGGPDPKVVEAEPFHMWAIEASPNVAAEFPVDAIWTTDITPYRERKVRILNGAHTTLVYPALLAGKQTVLECMNDSAIRGWLERAIWEEIIPTLTLDRADLEAFATATLERFSNPFVQHQLKKIAVSAISKYKVRVLPSVERYMQLTGREPKRLLTALAALMIHENLTEPPFDLPAAKYLTQVKEGGIDFSQ